jgi:hypothetical protein
MAANGLNIAAVGIEDKCPVVVRMIVGPKPRLAVVAPARADSGCVKAVDGSAIRNRKCIRRWCWSRRAGRSEIRTQPYDRSLSGWRKCVFNRARFDAARAAAPRASSVKRPI